MEKNQIRDLAEKYIQGVATPAEQEILHRWYNDQEDDDEEVVVTENPETTDSLKSRMLAQLLEQIGAEQAPEAVVRPITSGKKWYWAAAVVAIGIMIGGYFFIGPSTPTDTLAKTERFKNDIPAGGNHATLQLSDGSQVVLDNAANGMLAVQGGTQIVKNADGEISYRAKTAVSETLYNTISTPLGGQYALTLADGSKVWLNAETKLNFPASFTGKQRRVELSGEAYFEVAKNASQPFVVAMGQTGSSNYREVEVLGTHFNVKAYADEPVIKTTLLEGKVLVSVPSNGNSQILDPGQQVSIKQSGELDLNRNADVDEAVAWQQGLFRFKDESIREIMQYAQRWYGVEVVYQDEPSELFVTTIPRQSSLQQFLTILEATGKVRFTIDGKKVMVMAVK